MADWNAIGAIVGMLATGAGGAIITRFRAKRSILSVEEAAFGAIPQRRQSDRLAPSDELAGSVPQRRQSDRAPIPPCKQCTLEQDVDDFREEVKEGFDAVNLRLQSMDLSSRVQETKLANVDANVNELYGLIRQLSADVNKSLGKLEIMQSRGNS